MKIITKTPARDVKVGDSIRLDGETVQVTAKRPVATLNRWPAFSFETTGRTVAYYAAELVAVWTVQTQGESNA